MSNRWSPGCNCCDESEACQTVDTVTIDSEEDCLQPFAGTYDLNTITPNDYWSCSSSCPSSLEVIGFGSTCVVSSQTYASRSIRIFAHGAGSGIIYVLVRFTWQNFPNPDRYLTGYFVSTDNGATFSTYIEDSFPFPCAADSVTTTMPVDSSDLTCTVVLE